MIARMEELKRKETLLITLQKILPDVPEDFPKNYFCQLVYEDTVLTGTQKFTDFDENLIEEKFVLPLLFSNSIKVELWSAEEDPILYARSDINLEKDIETALISEACEGELFVKGETTLSYRLQLQGIGFSTWLRNITEVRELEAEKAYSRDQGAMKKEQMKQKVQEKKEKFQQKFGRTPNTRTHEYTASAVEQLLEELRID
jgi:hypothetical protein